jgi:hypothetical protein
MKKLCNHSRVHCIVVLLLMVFGQTVNANAKGLETIRLDQHDGDAGISLVKQSLLQLLAHVQLHVFIVTLVNQQQAQLNRFLAHAPAFLSVRTPRW